MSARPTPAPYHHGDLKSALLAEAEAILEGEGMTALTLRAVARAAKVSHAAPANHFTDLTDLLSEVAASGYRRFGEALAAAMDAAGDDPRSRMKAMGTAYVRFAREHKGLFVLMFRSERLSMKNEALRDAIVSARTALRRASVAIGTSGAMPLDAAARATAVWSLVHGFAVLLIDGRLDNTIASMPGEAGPDALLAAVLDVTNV